MKMMYFIKPLKISVATLGLIIGGADGAIMINFGSNDAGSGWNNISPGDLNGGSVWPVDDEAGTPTSIGIQGFANLFADQTVYDGLTLGQPSSALWNSGVSKEWITPAAAQDYLANPSDGSIYMALSGLDTESSYRIELLGSIETVEIFQRYGIVRDSGLEIGIDRPALTYEGLDGTANLGTRSVGWESQDWVIWENVSPGVSGSTASIFGISPTNALLLGCGDVSGAGAVTAMRITILSEPSPIHYVNINNTTPESPYGSWATAATNIQDAVDVAVDGDTVLVTNGNYLLASEILVTNDIVVQSVNGYASTVVDGGGAVRCFNLTNSSCVVGGFTITNGYSSGDEVLPDEARGAGVFCSRGNASATVSSCVVIGNTATHLGGGMYYGTAINCLFVGNSAGFSGGGKFGGILESCTVVGNTAIFNGGGVDGSFLYPGEVRNSIVFGNTATADPDYMQFFASCSPFLTHGMDGNITNEPSFVDFEDGDFRLSAASPCINSGNNSYVSSANDLAGNPRISYGTIDMGAYEFMGAAALLGIFGDYEYYLTFEGMTIPDARALAASQGGHLATISSQAVNDYLDSRLRDMVSDTSWAVWVGLSDEISEGSFLWDSGQPLAFLNWLPNEPNNVGNEDFVIFELGAAVRPTIPGWKDQPMINGDFLRRRAVYEVPLPRVDFTYVVNASDTNTVTITGYTGTVGAVAMPSLIEGKTVTAIQDDAFNFNTVLTEVTIPDSVVSIGERAFYDCTNLEMITIGDGVVTIDDYAFFRCTGLTNIVIPESVSSIGFFAFASCSGISSVTVDANNSVFVSSDGVLFSKDLTELVLYPAGKSGNYAISNGVTSVGTGAFAILPGLTNIVIPDSVMSLGSYAFYACTGMESVTVPDSVNTISDSAFRECSGLTNVTLGAGLVSIGGDAFRNCENITGIEFPEGITFIGAGAFRNCTGLISIAWPEGISSIGNEVFANCPSLMHVEIPGSVVSIGNSAFTFCSGLIELVIPDSVMTIGNNAFQFCSAITNIVVGSGVESIGNYTFYGCTSLSKMHFRGDAPAIGMDALFDTGLSTVHYLGGTEGWGATYGGRPVVPWLSPVQVFLGSMGIESNEFGFNIVGTLGELAVVEVCTNLVSGNWEPVSSNAIPSGMLRHNDPESTNQVERYYRLVIP